MSEKTTKAKAAAAAAAPVVQAKREAVIYVGPTLPRGQLHRNAVFRAGELPAHVKQLADADENIAALMVPASRLAVVMQRLNDPASIEADRVRKLTASFNKGGV